MTEEKSLSKFDKLSSISANLLGRPISFILACILCILWAFTGPLFNFSDAWQLLINTPTTILTFLFLFVIQNTEIRNSKATHAKLDALTSSVANFMKANKETDTTRKDLMQDISELKSSKGLEKKVSARDDE